MTPMLHKPYQNPDSPIDDLYFALRLLWASHNDHTERYLLTYSRFPDEKPCIVVDSFSGGYDHSCYSGSTYYAITNKLFETLKNDWPRLVGEAEGGYRHMSAEAYEISEEGYKKCGALYETIIESKRAKLVPGVHGQSSIYTFHGEEEFWRHKNQDPYLEIFCGQTYFGFSTPFGDKFGVFADGTALELPKNAWR